MNSLRLTVPLGVGETPASFASRLAARNGVNLREFCLDFGTTFQKVVDGERRALTIVAAKGGADPTAMAEYALTKTSRGRYAFRGESFVGGNLRRATVAVCPRCITGDIAAAPQLQPRLAAFGRAIWQFDAIKTCPLHTVSLVTIAEEVDIRMRHDFAHYIVRAVPRLTFLVGQAERRQLTALERYVITRLDGGRTSPFLDGVELRGGTRCGGALRPRCQPEAVVG